MTSPKLGKLVRLNPKTVWRDEPHGFTPWLAENITLLNEALGIETELVRREAPVGDFAVDLFAKEVGSGREVIIENQLEETDHKHLGQLLTYGAGLDAKIVVWISPQFRDEHKQAIDWLNRHTDEALAFFGVELQLFKIGDSPPAPNFKIVAQPSEWQKEVSGRYNQREIDYHKFFSDLRTRLTTRSPSFPIRGMAGYRSWFYFNAGRPGFSFGSAFGFKNTFRVELYIDTDSFDANKLAVDQLHDEKEHIEKTLGALEWVSPATRRARSISISRDGSIDSPPKNLDILKDWAVEQLLKFIEIFGPRLKELSLEAPLEERP